MILGLDFYGTITTNVRRFKDLAQTILDSKGEVYIISAVAPENEQRVKQDIKHSRIPYTDVDVITYTHHNQVPKLKLEKVRQRHVDIMVDDRTDTCVLLAKYGYTALAIAPRTAK